MTNVIRIFQRHMVSSLATVNVAEAKHHHFVIGIASQRTTNALRCPPLFRNDPYVVETFHLTNERITAELNILDRRFVKFKVESGEQRRKGQVELRPSKTKVHVRTPTFWKGSKDCISQGGKIYWTYLTPKHILVPLPKGAKMLSSLFFCFGSSQRSGMKECESGK